MNSNSKFFSLNNPEDAVNEAVSNSKGVFSVGELLETKKSLAKKSKKKKRKKKAAKIKKLCKKMRKELSVLENEVESLKKTGYDNKLNELIACNDHAERKKIVAELKKWGC